MPRPPTVSDDDIVDAIREHEDAVLSTSEVADELSLKRRGTLNRLKDLHDEGRIESKTFQDRFAVWWIPHDDDAPESDDR
ncbi:hypothetical protein [Halohasta litorea]|uniref:Winged helix-turn-helix DNA-binding n=1 Tax=Halohasta litorea TaxID=869891 RepID=A0ABD6DAM9_9EURY|nr:hypothetical protein [Halohasta litorea]